MKSYKQKLKDIPVFVARDPKSLRDKSGYCCFLCGDHFVDGDHYLGRTEHHLDGNTKNDEYWNRILVHNICNIRCENFIEWQVISRDIMNWNIKQQQPTTEQIKMATDSLLRDGVSIMIALNVQHSKICEETIIERMKVEPFWKRIDAIAECTLRCRDKTGHGSMQSIRNYITVLCAESGSFKIEELDGVDVIMKRTGS